MLLHLLALRGLVRNILATILGDSVLRLERRHVVIDINFIHFSLDLMVLLPNKIVLRGSLMLTINTCVANVATIHSHAPARLVYLILNLW